MSICIGCAWEYHSECLFPEADGLCCCSDQETPLGEPNKRGGPIKDGSEMADVLSTGRKRAAVAAPIEEGMRCEWSRLKYAGGGVVPIIGCFEGIASDRHHGPDKSVLNNEVGTNLHRICDFCHNRWHELNDKFYGERPPGGEPFLPIDKECLPHDPITQATEEEVFKYDLQWRMK